MLSLFKNIFSIINKIFNVSKDSPHVEPKGVFSNFRMGNKAKVMLVFLLVAILLVSFFTFMANVPSPIATGDDDPVDPVDITPQPSPTNNTQNNSQSIPTPGVNPFTDTFIPITAKAPGIIQSAQEINSTVWYKVAAKAWKYYQPGVGVDGTTGLPWTAINSPYITDWDIGVYIQAVIDASKLGLLGNDRTWGFSARMNMVLNFLEIRELNTANYPFQFYQANDGQVWKANLEKALFTVDVADSGRLLVALNNLREYDSTLKSRINNLVYNTYNNRSDYAALVSTIKEESTTSTNIYTYYVASGFASFWPNDLSSTPSKILDNIFSSGSVTTYGVTLPKAKITSDVLFCTVFELNNQDPRLMILAQKVYSAHEAYFNTTFQYRAFGEGSQSTTDWQWEWVVLPDGRTWTILDTYGQEINAPPIIYTKVVMSFLAVYNTSFSIILACHLEQYLPDFARGYCEGVDEAQVPFESVGSLTNGLILGAALYFIQNNP